MVNNARELMYYMELVERAEVAIKELISFGAPRADLLLSIDSKLWEIKDHYEDMIEVAEHIPGDDEE